MQMIDVLKRLAELDADNPNVAKPTMKAEESLATVSNISESVNECGPMGMAGDLGRPSTPASFSVNASAASGDEVANMLSQIMNLAGIGKDTGDAAASLDKEIELGTPHGVELDGGNGDMANMLGMIDKMNGPAGDDAGNPEDEGLGGALVGGAIGAATGGPLGALTGAAAGDSLTDPDEKEAQGDTSGQQSPVADMADEVQGMADELADINDGNEDESYDNSPEEEIRGHTYGNDQVTPKPQGLKQRLGDNPYKPVGESIEAVATDLLKAYEAFKAQQ